MKRPPSVWIVPDPMAEPGDHSLREVAHVETSTDAVALSAAWSNAASAAGAIGLVTVADPHRPEAIAAGTHFLVLEAYDGDGVIYLEREGPT